MGQEPRPMVVEAEHPVEVEAGGDDAAGEAPFEARPASFAEPVDLNAADERELERIRGLGFDQVQAILRYRHEHGPLTTWRELEEVPGLDAVIAGYLREVGTLGDEERASRR